MSRLFRRTGDLPQRTLWQKLRDVALTDVTVIARGGVAQGSLEQLEEVLIGADFGVTTTMRLVRDVELKAQRGSIKTQDDFLGALRQGIAAALDAGNSSTAIPWAAAGPTVILVVGVNGAGKTTLIGKLAARYSGEGKRVLVGAADTFRAGAIDQLRTWAERAGSDFVAGKPGSDPAAVAYDAVDAGSVRGADLVIVDTAGRLHTSAGLMDELKKIERAIAKRLPGAPHETLLVLDATIGQNAVLQARTFANAISISGIAITKLDGTARGGIVVAVHEALDVPVKFIGTGESAADLEEFDAGTFATEILES